MPNRRGRRASVRCERAGQVPLISEFVGRRFLAAAHSAPPRSTVPAALLAQMAIGGRRVIPVGPTPGTQELVRVRRTAADRYDRETRAVTPLGPPTATHGMPETYPFGL